MLKNLVICLIVLATIIACNSAKQSTGDPFSFRTTVEVVTGRWDSVTRSFPVAIRFRIPSRWKMFWMNTGRYSIKPYEVGWHLPQDWNAEKLLFPVPQKVIESDEVEYIYRDSLMLSTHIYTSREPGGELIQLKLRWLECTSAICMWRDSLFEFEYKPFRQGGFPQIDTLPILANLGINTGAYSDSSTDDRDSFISWYVKVLNSDSLRITDYYPSYSENARVKIQMIGDRAYIDVDLIDSTLGYGIVGGIVFVNHKPYWESVPMLWPPDSAG
jgi:hypothetical protein